MGVGIFANRSYSSYDKYPQLSIDVPSALPNPNPLNYKITVWASIGRFLVVKVNYPDCKNYEGDKVLLYEDVKVDDLINQKHLDPHFSNSTEFHSPIARFEPTRRGWLMAVIMATEMDKLSTIK